MHYCNKKHESSLYSSQPKYAARTIQDGAPCGFDGGGFSPVGAHIDRLSTCTHTHDPPIHYTDNKLAGLRARTPIHNTNIHTIRKCKTQRCRAGPLPFEETKGVRERERKRERKRVYERVAYNKRDKKRQIAGTF